MKKAIFILFFITAINISAFSLTSEAWLYFGFEYGNFFDSYTEQNEKVHSYMGSPGLNFGGYRFFNKKNYGVFVHDFFAVPVNGYKEINGVSKDNDYDYAFQIGMIIGPGFRYNFSENFTLKWAAGFSLLMTWFGYDGYLWTYGDVFYDVFSVNYGIGGDIGFKWNITKTFFINAGSIFTFDFLRYIIMDTSFNKKADGWEKDFFMLAVRPYITIGFIINKEYN